MLEGDLGPLSWHADALGTAARDYDIPGSPTRQDNTFNRSTSVAGGVAWNSERARAGFSVSRFRSDYGIPAPEDPLAPSFISLEQERYEIEGDLTPGGPWIDTVRDARTTFTRRSLTVS